MTDSLNGYKNQKKRFLIILNVRMVNCYCSLAYTIITFLNMKEKVSYLYINYYDFSLLIYIFAKGNRNTYTIITTQASKQFSKIHDRMPVILDWQEASIWLDGSKTQWDKELSSLLKPFDKDLEIYAVTKEMSKPGSSKRSYIEPIADRKDGIKSFFNKQNDKSNNNGLTSSPSSNKTKYNKKRSSSPIKIEDDIVEKPKKIKKEQ